MSRSRIFAFAAVFVAALFIVAGWIRAQQPPTAAGGGSGQAQAGAGALNQKARGARGAVISTPDDTSGFRAIFDGKTLNGWNGDPMFWRVEDGVIVGESTPEKVVVDNTFLIWKDGNPKNFELKVDVKFASEAGNSGIQIRSRMATEPTGRSGKPRPWGMAGYQVDLIPVGGPGTGLIYEEGGRGFLARQGQITRRLRDAQGAMSSKLIGTLGDNIDAIIKPAREWNSFHIIAQGNQITVVVNGRVSAIVIDEDATGRAMEGLLGLQMHVGPPFRVDFKNIYLKEL
jgi:hypothetical protein